MSDNIYTKGTSEAVMTDGPFKNSKLNSRWKRFLKSVHNDAFDRVECCALASDALLREILNDGVSSLLAKLQAYVSRKQLELDPLLSIGIIFETHQKTPFTDMLQKEVALCIGQEVVTANAVRKAVEAAVTEQSCQARNRNEEECICTLEDGKISRNEFSRTVNRINAIFDSLAKSEICEALLSGNKSAFKKAVSKKEGIDEGPRL